MTLSARDLEPGQILTGPSRTITQADLTFACMASGDWSPIHADAEFAAATPLGGPVLPGGYGLMIALGMSAQVLHLAEPVLALLGLDNWRFAAPIQAGHTIRLEIEVVEFRETSDGARGILRSHLRLKRQDGEIAQEGDHALMLSLA